MIRVQVKASSPIARAGIESLLRGRSDFELVDESSDDFGEAGHASELPLDVLVVECETLADGSAREAIDWASAGGAVVLLVRNPATDSIAEALRAGVKAVLPSRIPGPEIV